MANEQSLAAPASVAEAARIVACHLPQADCPDSVCLPITMTARDLRSIYDALTAGAEPRATEAGEDAAWTWLDRHVECDPADRDYSADEMVDAFMAGQSSRPPTPSDADADKPEEEAVERQRWIDDARDFAERMISQPAACETIERLLMIIDAHPPKPTKGG